MGLKASPHDPCILSGILANLPSPETMSAVQSQLHVVLYVEDFVLYSSDPTQKYLFKTHTKNTSKLIKWEMLTIS